MMKRSRIFLAVFTKSPSLLCSSHRTAYFRPRRALHVRLFLLQRNLLAGCFACYISCRSTMSLTWHITYGPQWTILSSVSSFWCVLATFRPSCICCSVYRHCFRYTIFVDHDLMTLHSDGFYKWPSFTRLKLVVLASALSSVVFLLPIIGGEPTNTHPLGTNLVGSVLSCYGGTYTAPSSWYMGIDFGLRRSNLSLIGRLQPSWASFNIVICSRATGLHHHCRPRQRHHNIRP